MVLIVLETMKESNPYSWVSVTWKADQLLSRINQRHAGSDYRRSFRSLHVAERGISGRVISVVANGHEKVQVSYPDAYRTVIGGLRSTRFDIDQTNDLTILAAGNVTTNVKDMYPAAELYVLTGHSASTAQPVQGEYLYAMNGKTRDPHRHLGSHILLHRPRLRAWLGHVPVRRQGAGGAWDTLPEDSPILLQRCASNQRMNDMDIEQFDYELPESLIAQTPLSDRSSSRLMTLNKLTGEIGHYQFRDLVHFVKPGDVLVLNDTRVIPARLIGRKRGGGAHVELLLLKQLEEDRWETLARPGRRLKKGAWIDFGEDAAGEPLLSAEVEEELPDGGRLVRFNYEGVFPEILDMLGQMPLPPYIREKLEDKERYQTVYAQHAGLGGSAYGGLHFTEESFPSNACSRRADRLS